MDQCSGPSRNKPMQVACVTSHIGVRKHKLGKRQSLQQVVPGEPDFHVCNDSGWLSDALYQRNLKHIKGLNVKT